MAELLQEGSFLRLKAGKLIKGKHFSYDISKQIDSGGSGIVYLAKCNETQADVAIKFFFPLYDIEILHFESSSSKIQALENNIKFFQKEIECLSQTNHPSIVRLLDTGGYKIFKGEIIHQFQDIKFLNFFVMDFIPGQDVTKYLHSTNNRTQVIYLLRKLCDALIYLHEVKEYLHADIRSANILIREGTAEPVIIDFALYKNFNFKEADPKEITRLYGDWDLFPKDLRTDDPLKKIKETEGRREDLKSLCFPGLDLFQFGKLIRSLHGQLSKIFSVEDVMYLTLIEEELLSWERVKTLSARWLAEQISKLDPAYSQFMGVEELTPPSSAKKTFQLPGKVITISPLIEKIYNTRSFRRLRSINQLAFIDILYPGAGYRRHLHCLRAYGYCAEFIESLVQSPRFRLLFNPSLATQALAISLLHDINHFPLLHVFQEVPGWNIELLDLFCDGKATQDSPSIYEILEEIGITREQFRDLLFLKYHQLLQKDYSPGLQIVKFMIDSGADIDKLAYLEDDSFFTGVAYGRGVDSARLISSATIVKIPESISKEEGWAIGFREEGLSAVESLVMARFWMFRTVYWHRINRAIMTMLLHIIKKLYIGDKVSANVSDFVIDTMWGSEEFVLKYLNERYYARFGKNSIVNLILKDRKTVYERLFSIQGVSSNTQEAELYNTITMLDALKLETFRRNLCEELEKYIRNVCNAGITIGEDDLLIDIPGRRLDTAGPICIEQETGEVRRIEDIQGPVQRVVIDFERLAKRMRIFVPQSIIDIVSRDKLVNKRSDILNVLENSLSKDGVDQVR